MSRWRDRLAVALATVILGTTLVSAQPFSRPSGPGLTVVAGGAGGVGGSGTANTIAKFTAGSTLGNSLLTDDGTNVTLSSGALKIPDYSGSGAATVRGATHATYGVGIDSAGLVWIVSDTSGGGVQIGAAASGSKIAYISGQGAMVAGSFTNAGGFFWDTSAVLPSRAQVISNNTTDFGSTSFRWKSVYAGTSYALVGANGQKAEDGKFEEAHTLAAAGTSDTSGTIAANSRTRGVVFRITTEITGCATVDAGIAGATNRFGTFSALTSGTTLLSTDNSAYATATAIRFTCVGGGASFTAGAIRVTPFYDTLTAPTS